MATGAPELDVDPMSRVLEIGESSPASWFGYTLGAFALLLGLMVSARVVARVLESMNPTVVAPPLPPQEIEVMQEPAPPPPPAPTQAEAEKPPEPAPPPPPAAKTAPPPKEAPAPAPAQAAKVLAQEPDPNEPVDLTGNTIVTGNADTYAGGTTASNGTGTRAVRGLAVPNGAPAGTGTVAAPPHVGPDRSRKASVGSTEWNAPFPPEADTAQIDEAYVTLQIDVRPDGTAAAVRIASDPGNGFGREARKYALAHRYAPALDADGNAIPSTFTTRVHFSR